MLMITGKASATITVSIYKHYLMYSKEMLSLAKSTDFNIDHDKYRALCLHSFISSIMALEAFINECTQNNITTGKFTKSAYKNAYKAINIKNRKRTEIEKKIRTLQRLKNINRYSFIFPKDILNIILLRNCLVHAEYVGITSDGLTRENKKCLDSVISYFKEFTDDVDIYPFSFLRTSFVEWAHKKIVSFIEELSYLDPIVRPAP